MNTIIITIGGDYTALCLGRRGENEATQIVFDVSELVAQYGAGAAVVLNKRVNDANAYPVSTVQEGNRVSWIVTNTDTSYTGQGEAELLWYVNDTLAKTLVWTTFVAQDIGIPSGPTPDPFETWLDQLTELAGTTEQNAQAAEAAQGAAETAQGKAEDAQEAAEASEIAAKASEDSAEEDALKSEGFAVGEQNGAAVTTGSPYFMNNSKFYSEVAQQAASLDGWVYFYIDNEGNLHYVKTANCALEFYIDGNGHLHVTNGG